MGRLHLRAAPGAAAAAGGRELRRPQIRAPPVALQSGGRGGGEGVKAARRPQRGRQLAPDQPQRRAPSLRPRRSPPSRLLWPSRAQSRGAQRDRAAEGELARHRQRLRPRAPARRLHGGRVAGTRLHRKRAGGRSHVKPPPFGDAGAKGLSCGVWRALPGAQAKRPAKNAQGAAAEGERGSRAVAGGGLVQRDSRLTRHGGGRAIHWLRRR